MAHQIQSVAYYSSLINMVFKLICAIEIEQGKMDVIFNYKHSMQALPIFFNIKNRHCVVIGGGDVAMRKVTMLLKADAAISLISPELCHELQNLVDVKKIKYLKADFADDQLQGACLVIAATDDDSVNEAVSIAAKAANIPVNVVDSPDLCTFTMGDRKSTRLNSSHPRLSRMPSSA